jgi:hypothetical protein
MSWYGRVPKLTLCPLCANHDTKVGSGSSGGGGEEGFTGRAALGYDHGYDGEVFYFGLALDPHYVDGWVEGCLERIGEDNPEARELAVSNAASPHSTNTKTARVRIEETETPTPMSPKHTTATTNLG